VNQSGFSCSHLSQFSRHHALTAGLISTHTGGYGAG
jgi:hypothetical protein